MDMVDYSRELIYLIEADYSAFAHRIVLAVFTCVPL
jgi:sulfate adenylyltransferase subunit 1 (EFTu-like GTPase family)